MISKEYFDVIIVGSGPAGASAAYSLARRNVKVLLIEKAGLPRYKTCGGGFVGKASKLLSFKIDEIAEQYCRKVEVYDHSAGVYLLSERRDPIILMTMRQDLDNFLISAARKEGAAIEDNCEVTDISLKEDKVEIETSKGKITAAFLVASDGAAGICARKSGWKNNARKLPALEYEITVSEKLFERYSNSARFDFGIAQNGYGWVFPKKSHLSVGIVNMKKGKGNLHDIFEQYLRKLNIDEIISIEKHGFYIPLMPRVKKFTKERIFFTGDAAGFADPVTAEGISHAILSGQLAADAIIESNFDKNSAAEIYNREIREKILREIRFSSILGWLIYKYSFLRILFFKIYGKRLCRLMTDVFTGEKKYSDLLLDPVNYLKLIKYFFYDKKEEIRRFENLPPGWQG